MLFRLLVVAAHCASRPVCVPRRNAVLQGANNVKICDFFVLARWYAAYGPPTASLVCRHYQLAAHVLSDCLKDSACADYREQRLPSGDAYIDGFP